MKIESESIASISASPSAVDIAIAAWLHAKQQRSQSQKTLRAYSSILHAYRVQLQTQGYDLDAADPQRVRQVAAQTRDVDAIVNERLTRLTLTAQAFAAQPTQTRYGQRPVAPTTANLRLAVLSSFYAYALRQDLLHGSNPIARVERHSVQAYASARPLDYETLAEQLNAISVATPAGLRDYALLVLALHTGRRLSELAAMRWHDIVVRKSKLGLTWPRCKGGKIMHDELPRKGKAALASEALLAWMQWLATQGHEVDGHAIQTVQPDHPLWISLARNGTFGQPLSIRAIAILCEKRLGTSKVHALRHTFARALEDAGAKVSDIQAHLGHTSLDTTGRYLAQLHQGENPHLARLVTLYGLEARSTLSREAGQADTHNG